jgi:EAL domain-containing protein (putative c-di-GMP-specific phosphodiesterase class I)
MAVSLDIKVVAMAVENQAQIDAFNALGVTLYQGYHFGAPAPL